MITELISESVDAFGQSRLNTCARTPAGQVQEYGTATVLFSGSGIASLNLVVATTPDPDPADVSRAASALNALGRPGRWSSRLSLRPKCYGQQRSGT